MKNKKTFKIDAHELKKVISDLVTSINSFDTKKIDALWKEIDRVFAMFKIEVRFFANKVDYFLSKISEEGNK